MAYGENGMVDETKLHQLISRFVRTQRLKNSWRPMNDLTEHPLLKSQQRSSSAPSVSDSALPDWVCRATRESIDGPTSHSLLIRRTTTMPCMNTVKVAQ